jgi:hypothetical protein
MDDININLKNMLVILHIGSSLCFNFMNNVCLEHLVFKSKISKVLFNLIWKRNDILINN